MASATTNPLQITESKKKMCVNVTKENETLYFFPEEQILFLIEPIAEGTKYKFQCITGSSAAFFYKRLATATEKKCLVAKHKELLEKLYKIVDKSMSESIDACANYEILLSTL